ncbi:DNA photolyase, FAD-binding/Cryptochrome [Mariannaea sp. PMI_226]|nr:DNA photolyase, FAD-binding/Cryptochrome [Mariannaea sp. PMI_226]
MAGSKLLVYLLRRDLRITDNPIFWHLSSTQHEYTHLLPVFVIPPHQIEVSGFLVDGETSPYPQARSKLGNFWRCGPHRAKFLAQSVWDLKASLGSVKSGLVTRIGSYTDVLKSIIESLEGSDHTLSSVWMTDEKGYEEAQDQDSVLRFCTSKNINFTLWPDEKYYIDDRDVPLETSQDLPFVFTEYLKLYESLRPMPRPSLPRPATGALPPLPCFNWLPPQARPFKEATDYEEFVFRLLKPIWDILPDALPRPPNAVSNHTLKGGETQAWERIAHLVAANIIAEYEYNRNELMGMDYSTKLSAYLALGCITARQINEECVKFENNLAPRYHLPYRYKNGEIDGTRALRVELLWRDFMRLSTAKWGSRIFSLKGIRPGQHKKSWKTADKLNAKPTQTSSPERVQEMIDRFLEGRTGMGLIDASQRELYHTGYTSNRARQNVASFFAKYLGIDWRYGAEWYESMLVDYDVSSNWGNWQYAAGVGNDPRSEDRILNPVKQAFQYDIDGEFTRMWVPEVKDILLLEHVFQVWTTGRAELQRYDLLGDIMVNDPLVKVDFNPDRAPRPSNKPFPWWMRNARRRGGNRGRGRHRGGGGSRIAPRRRDSESESVDSGVSASSASTPRSTEAELQTTSESSNDIVIASGTPDQHNAAGSGPDSGSSNWVVSQPVRGNLRGRGRGGTWGNASRGRGGRIEGYRPTPPQTSQHEALNHTSGPASALALRVTLPGSQPPLPLQTYHPPPRLPTSHQAPPATQYTCTQQLNNGSLVHHCIPLAPSGPIVLVPGPTRPHGPPVSTSSQANASTLLMPHSRPPGLHYNNGRPNHVQQPCLTPHPNLVAPPYSVHHPGAVVPYGTPQYPSITLQCAAHPPQYLPSTHQYHSTTYQYPLQNTYQYPPSNTTQYHVGALQHPSPTYQAHQVPPSTSLHPQHHQPYQYPYCGHHQQTQGPHIGYRV